MSGTPTATGAKAYLSRDTTEDELVVEVSLWVDLDDGRRVALAPDRFVIGGPRRGLAGVWVGYEWSPGELGLGDEPPGEDELKEALERHYAVRARDIEDAIREELFEKPPGVEVPAWEMLADELEQYTPSADRPDPDRLCNLPFTLELDDVLLLELSAARPE